MAYGYLDLKTPFSSPRLLLSTGFLCSSQGRELVSPLPLCLSLLSYSSLPFSSNKDAIIMCGLMSITYESSEIDLSSQQIARFGSTPAKHSAVGIDAGPELDG